MSLVRVIQVFNKMSIVITSLLLISVATNASSNFYLTMAPNVASSSQTNNIYEMSMGSGCHVMLGLEQVLPCNPAFMGEVAGRHFQASFLAGDDYKFVSKGVELLNEDKTYEFAKELFNKKDLVNTSTVVQFSARNGILGVEVVPYKNSFWILSRNSSNPKIAVQAVSEKSVAVVLGGMVNRHHSAGIKVKYAYREVMLDEFSFLEATHSQREILSKKIQNVLVLEPGYAFFSDNQWQTRVSAVIKGWEFHKEDIDGGESQPKLVWGVAVTPYNKNFIWDIGLAHELSDEVDTGLTLVSQTHFDSVSWFSKLATEAYAIGASFKWRDLQWSMRFEEEDFSKVDKGLPYQRSWLFQASYIF